MEIIQQCPAIAKVQGDPARTHVVRFCMGLLRTATPALMVRLPYSHTRVI